MIAGSIEELALARADAAEALEGAIVALGAAYRSYQRLTGALAERTGTDLSFRMEVPIVLHLSRAGLGAFLERKLTGTPAGLRSLVEPEHARGGIA
jgi:hypothetical protein